MEDQKFASISQFSLLLPILFIIFLFKLITHLFLKRRRTLPPGPKPWPVIGNLLHVGKQLHKSTADLAKQYGPLISLRLGTQIVVIAHSPATAAEILKIQDRLLSTRFVLKTIPYSDSQLERIALIWNPNCNDQWKSLRSLSRTQLFSAKAIESQAKLREAKMTEMVEFLKSKAKQGETVNIGEIVFATVFNTISNLFFSRDFIGLEDEERSGGLKSLLWKLMEIGLKPNVAQFYPILEPIDPQGLKRSTAKYAKQMYSIWERDIEARRDRPRSDIDGSSDFLDVFLANGFHDDQINWLALEFFTAATDTTTTAIEWAMSELLRNKQVTGKLEEELEKEITGESIDESRVCELPYLNACIKETLRLHPPGPLLLPHRSPEDCDVMGYTIPKDAQVFVNVWAVGRDPSVWDDPLFFKPERFLSSSIDVRGHDFQLIPFGSGRRICPGLPLAMREISLILGYSIYFFNWFLPNDKDPMQLDMTEKFGITLQRKQPLLVTPRCKHT